MTELVYNKPFRFMEERMKYTRRDIFALSNRLEVKAAVMLDANAGKDLMAAALLLRLLSQLSDVQTVETGAVGSLQ